MDPIAHTLVGASLGHAGLARWTRGALPALIIGANLPDVDGVVTVLGMDAMYALRRGWTHGVLAMVVWPVVLAGAVHGLAGPWERWRAARGKGATDTPPRSFPRLLLVSALAVWSHPLLDWMNTYGVRLLMPFDGRWFYGDSLFILDPWMWLCAGAGTMLAWSRTRARALGWVVMGLGMTGLMVFPEQIPWPASVAWLVGMGALVGLRLRPQTGGLAIAVSRWAMALLAVYIGAMVAASHLARGQATAFFADQGIAATEVAVGPVPANPLVRDAIARTPEGYRFARVDWTADPSVVLLDQRMPGVEGVGNAQVLTTEGIQGFLNWSRFTSLHALPEPGGGARWVFQDARYAATGATIGRAEVVVDPAGSVLRTEFPR